eukprot:Gregarina_sp_Poly_1__9157@NODE_562_length_7523_cov_90_276019_g442_i0_p5_GENE_NODE_562_length_7523_cov_90_276019_g442_i0NODE_562_length_7523_cov_90_276019_g442_i0_p5_ORF_typecomplete_len313_score32_49UNC50/PF05216_13/1_5e28_NODE_562_length_7523_cov_90_276019_g442_i07231661
MLPSHKFPSRQPWHSFFRRLVSWKQIDWDSTFTQALFALFYPSRLALVASHRLQTQGQLARGDPGVFLCLLYLAGASGLAYGSALVTSHNTHEQAVPFSSRGQLLGVLFWGFLLWPVFLTAVLTIGSSFGLFFILKRFGQLSRRSLALSIAHTMQPAVNVLFDETKRAVAQPANGDDSSQTLPSIYASDAASVDWAYCFDLICNGSISGLFILCSVQYLLLPFILARSFPALIGAMIGNTLHLIASFMFIYNVAAGVTVLRSPLWRAASMLFAPLTIWILVLVSFTVCKINISAIILELLFAPFLPVEQLSS